MKNFFLTLSGLIDGAIAGVHLVRLLMKWPVRVGTLILPQKASLWACLIFMVLSLGCFIARGKSK